MRRWRRLTLTQVNNGGGVGAIIVVFTLFVWLARRLFFHRFFFMEEEHYIISRRRVKVLVLTSMCRLEAFRFVPVGVWSASGLWSPIFFVFFFCKGKLWNRVREGCREYATYLC